MTFGPAYLEVTQQVVCRRGGEIPEDVESLVGRQISVIAESSYEERLESLKKDHPDLAWKSVKDEDTEQLLQRVYDEEIDCTVADSNIVTINRRYHPELEVAFDLGEPEEIAWVLAPEWLALSEPMDSWFETMRKSGELTAVHDRYYGHIDQFDYVDVSVFSRRIDERLPRYRPLFEEAAEEVDLPWTLLAAQSYQESHWDPEAKSPTGVRGMMMLSERTASSLDVDDRLDPEQSIFAGARYLDRMLERIPEEVQDDDRLWFALAAYNIGFGHVQDARELARKLGRDGNRWVEMKEVFPLLSKRKYYRDLKYGYARGEASVAYVSRIRDYRDVLEKSTD